LKQELLRGRHAHIVDRGHDKLNGLNRIAAAFDQALELALHRNVFHSLRKDGLLRESRAHSGRTRAIELDVALIELTDRRRSEESIGDEHRVRNLFVVIRL
jgi:hypothetical protein